MKRQVVCEIIANDRWLGSESFLLDDVMNLDRSLKLNKVCIDKKMDIDVYLEELQQELSRNNALEAILEKYESLCLLDDPQASMEIKQIDFSSYKTKIKVAFKKAIKLTTQHDYKGIYFEYGMDNDWVTDCFLGTKYNRIEENDEDWACPDENGQYFHVTKFPELAEIYEKYNDRNHYGGSFDRLVNLYLIVRTVVAFKEAIGDKISQTSAAVCVAFHGQNVITRFQDFK